MLLDLPLAGRPVLVLGDTPGAARVAHRYESHGAWVRRATTPAQADAILLDPEAGPVLAVDATAGASEWVATCRRARRRLLTATEEPGAHGGRITLIGAGPGDPGLLTVAARRALADADVILLDRLATHEDELIVEDYAPAAQVVAVGKSPGRHRVTQEEIQSVMVRRALDGAHVVRLKGGDPFVFGRGGEEVMAARAAGVPVTVIPGITSAVAVPGAVGVPVTHKGLARAFTVISGHDPFDAELCAHLVGVGGTLVILMGMGTLVQSIAGLLRAGLPGDTPVTVVQRGFTPQQRAVSSTAQGVAAAVAEHGITSPAVVVVGAVAGVEGLLTAPRA